MYRVHGCAWLRNGCYSLMVIRRISWTDLELDAAYVPHKIEQTDGTSYFVPCKKIGKRFSIVLPPPNVTGSLHLGHALTAAVEDTIVRWKKMQGVDTVWVPGIDHAGIATQVVVEKLLKENEGKTRHEIGREEFRRRVYRWKDEKEEVIEKQLRRLGCSLDWYRKVFTMDDKRSRAVRTAFTRLFNDGLIYRSDHLVNWSCILQSAISDIEVEHLGINGPTAIQVPGYEKPIEFGTIFNFSYKLNDSNEEIVVATTRPETIPGDVAVAVHPKDDRYMRYVGRTLRHPFRNEPIPIIADEFVDPHFGTGAVKVTPAHDQSDFDVSKRHNLKLLQTIDETGRLTLGEFRGIPRFDARFIIVEKLAQMSLLRGKEDHQMTVPICSRSRDVIELLVRPQWFLRCKEMAAKAVDDVRTGRLKIEPGNFENVWFNWLENVRDWCISRQLWWGHRIPAYSCSTKAQPERKTWIAAEDDDIAVKKAVQLLQAQKEEVLVKRDEDVLDTWFSSALQPFSAFDPDDLHKYYPLSLMETGNDILFFWVARMVMLGTYLTGKLPFNEVLLHGIVCDSSGRKMSKSLGNVIAPEDVIDGASLDELALTVKRSTLSKEELVKALDGQKRMFPTGIPECGADALRFTLLSHNVKSHFVNFNVDECHTNKLFCNKIWQATKFVRLSFTDEANPHRLTLMDKWILSRLSRMVNDVQDGLQKYNFHECTNSLKNFLYYEFCDVYLECTKKGVRDKSLGRAPGHCWTLCTCLDVGLRTLAPFMPFLTEHLHQRLPLVSEKGFPDNLSWFNEGIEKDVRRMNEIVVAIRRLKRFFNVTSKHKPEVHLKTTWSSLSDYLETIQELSGCHKLTTDSISDDLRKCSVEDVVSDTTIFLVVPEELRKAIQLDISKVEAKKTKLLKELAKMDKMVSGATYSVNATLQEQENHSKKIVRIKEQLSRLRYIQSLSTL